MAMFDAIATRWPRLFFLFDIKHHFALAKRMEKEW